MRFSPSLALCVGATVVCMLASCSALGQAAPEEPPLSQKQDDLLKPSDRPLDARIKSDKITEYDPPPLPRQVVVPPFQSARKRGRRRNRRSSADWITWIRTLTPEADGRAARKPRQPISPTSPLRSRWR